jgi:hypothetical protein
MTVNATAIMSAAAADYATCFLAIAQFLMSRPMAVAVKGTVARIACELIILPLA